MVFAACHYLSSSHHDFVTFLCPVLDAKQDERHRYRMRTICAVITMMVLTLDACAQTTAPLEVVNSAITAVNDLGRQVVLGKLKVSLERMYPQWKDRLSRRTGSEQALEKQFDQALAEMMKQGTSMVSFKTHGFPRVYEVYPGKKVEVIDGKEVETLINTKWLLLVPTEIRYRVMQQQEVIIIESKGFQVAIADKDKLQWTFIDGAGVTVQDLRSLFISLPKDMQLPEFQRRTVPKEELQKR
jgi:hypothetical protein